MRTVITAVALTGCLLLAGCGIDTSRINGTVLQDDVGPTFHNMYLLQQRWLGHDDVSAAVDISAATCTKSGASMPAVGAGDDWVCVVHWPAPSGITEPIAYDVRVAPGGCYTAQGPATVIGQQTMRDANGASVPNPLYEFDGCLG